MNLSRYLRLTKEGIWIIVGQIASVLGSLVLVRMLTEHLNPSQYGQLALGLTAAGLVNQVVMGGIISGIGRFYSIATEKQDLHNYLRASRYLMKYATIAVVILGFILTASLLLLGYSQWIGLSVAALVFSVISGYNASLSNIQNAARQRSIVAFHSGLDAWLKILLTVGVIPWLGASSTSVVIGYTFSSLLVTGSQFFFLRRLIPLQVERTVNIAPWMQQMYTYSWPFSAWGIFTWAQQSSDRWALQAFTTTNEVGLYAVLFQLSMGTMSVLTNMGIRLLSPIMYQIAGSSKDHIRNLRVHWLTYRIVMFCFLATLLCFFTVIRLHEQIFHLLVANEYNIVSKFMPWLVLASGIFATAQVIAVKLECELRTKVLLKCKIVSAIVGIISCLGCTYAFGITGTVIGQIIFALLYFALLTHYDISRNLK